MAIDPKHILARIAYLKAEMLSENHTRWAEELEKISQMFFGTTLVNPSPPSEGFEDQDADYEKLALEIYDLFAHAIISASRAPMDKDYRDAHIIYPLEELRARLAKEFHK